MISKLLKENRLLYTTSMEEMEERRLPRSQYKLLQWDKLRRKPLKQCSANEHRISYDYC